MNEPRVNERIRAREVRVVGPDGSQIGIKPLPEAQLVDLMRRYRRVVTVEEAVLDGGVGSAIAALAMDHELDCRLLRIGLPCAFVEPGSNEELARAYRLDADGILARIQERWS